MASGSYDAVIVGAGIAGGALATVLARTGKSVLLLEKTAVHRDRVRGEWLAPWGVAELQTLGLYGDFIAAGGHHLKRHIGYSDEIAPADAEAATIPLDALYPGIPGPMTIGHPTQCNLLDDLAVKCGVEFLRNVDDVRVAAGASPCVEYSREGVWHEARCRIVVGADGRGSNVRRQLGIELHQDPQHHWFSGMLVENAHGWPDDLQAIGAENDVHYLVFPQGGGRARLYLGYAIDQPKRLTGPEEQAQRAFLDAFALKSVPHSDAIVNATPAGPCNSYPNQDAWTDEPFVRGAVLVGDAAGYNDPIIGQGLSIAYRDVRIVRDILLAHDDWSDPAIFAPYAEERRERMRRLRFSASLQSRVENEFGPQATERRRIVRERQAANPMLQLPLLATMLGPDRVPDAAFEDAVVEQLFA